MVLHEKRELKQLRELLTKTEQAVEKLNATQAEIRAAGSGFWLACVFVFWGLLVKHKF